MLIHFNGMAGVGKKTIATIVAEKIGAHFIHNHDVINAVYAAGCDHGSDDYLEVHSKISEIIYGSLTKSPHIKDIVMTNSFISDIEENYYRIEKIIEMANARNEPFVPILLVCDEGENIKRLSNPGRKELRKMTDPDKLRFFLDRGLKFKHPSTPIAEYTLDVSHFTPEQSASAVIGHLKHLNLHP